MKTTLIILGLLIAVIFQTSLLPFLAFKGISPNLVLVLVLLLVIFKGFKRTWPLVILAGLFLDLLSGLPFGLISLALLMTAYFTDLFNRNIFSGSNFGPALLLIGLASLFYNLILVGLAKLFILLNLSQREIYPAIFSLNFLADLFLTAFYNLIVLTFLYGIKKIFYPSLFSK